MTRDHAPEDFDWVSAQAGCAPASMFERLRAGVRQDVERRNALDGLEDEARFEFSEDSEAFDVARLEGSRFGQPKIAALVRFERAGRRINVHGEDVEVDFTAVSTLDPNGQCRFVVGEALYSEWEIRRMALELLFFDEPDDSLE
jgi:hypothetical protein